MRKKKNWWKREEENEERETGQREEEGERGFKICFWNIAGIRNKCEETWKYLEQFDVIGLTEMGRRGNVEENQK